MPKKLALAVAAVDQENGGWRLSLDKDADPQNVLKALAVRPGVTVERFELAEPSLDDIFVTVVTRVD